MIYLDNSATTFPKPPQVIRAVDEAMRQYGFNPGRGGYRQSLRTAQKVYEIRGRIRRFFNVFDDTGVIFTSGCTEALNMALKGVLKKGDHVVISSLEHNAVLRPLYKMSESGEISYSIAAVVPGDDEQTLQNFREAINRRTKLFVCTHASNVFGTRLPTERLCALAHSNGILFCLDAAQSAGVFDIDMERDRYDFVCCAGHKYLYGPMGIGLLLLGNNNLIETLREGGTGSESSSLAMPRYYPDRLEAGTVNIPGIFGLGAGIGFVAQKGVSAIYYKEMKLIDSLCRQLKSVKGVTVFRDDLRADRSAPVLSLTVDGKDNEEIARKLSERAGICVRGGLHCAPLAHESVGTADTGTVRVAPSTFTTENDIRILTNSLRNLV